MDFYEKERNIVYAAIDYDISDKTLLSFAASYQELNRDGVRWGAYPHFIPMVPELILIDH